MKPLSLDLRIRIMDAHDAGLKSQDIADLYGVGIATVKRLIRLRRDTGSLEAGKSTGRTPILDDTAQSLMQAWLREKNDLTLGELQERLKASNYNVCVSAIFRRLKALGLTHKKKRCAQPNKSETT